MPIKIKGQNRRIMELCQPVFHGRHGSSTPLLIV